MIKSPGHNKNLQDTKIKKVNNIKIGKCIKIINSNKTFQIVGLDHKRNICWVREWPLKNCDHNTFELSVNSILIPTICPLERRDYIKSKNV